VNTEDPYDYLNVHAAKLKMAYPHCKTYISDLLAQYKKDLKEKTTYHGDTAFDVIDDFRTEVRRHCHRKKARPSGKPRKTSRK
jgi:hypothetical protein